MEFLKSKYHSDTLGRWRQHERISFVVPSPTAFQEEGSLKSRGAIYFDKNVLEIRIVPEFLFCVVVYQNFIQNSPDLKYSFDCWWIFRHPLALHL